MDEKEKVNMNDEINIKLDLELFEPENVPLRPRCGFCGKDIKKLLEMMDSAGVTIHCCSECGTVLGVTKDSE